MFKGQEKRAFRGKIERKEQMLHLEKSESGRLQGQGKEETEGKVSKKSRRGRRSDRIIGLRV